MARAGSYFDIPEGGLDKAAIDEALNALIARHAE